MLIVLLESIAYVCPLDFVFWPVARSLRPVEKVSHITWVTHPTISPLPNLSFYERYNIASTSTFHPSTQNALYL